MQVEIKISLKRCRICITWKGDYSASWYSEEDMCSKYDELSDKIQYTNAVKIWKENNIQWKFGISCDTML